MRTIARLVPRAFERRQRQYEEWLEPTGREALGGSPLYSGPGGGGSFELWSFLGG